MQPQYSEDHTSPSPRPPLGCTLAAPRLQVATLQQPVDELLEEERAAYAAAAKAANGAAAKAAVDLDMRVTLVDGDEVIADTTEEGDFLAACKKFEGHIRQRFPRAAAA